MMDELDLAKTELREKNHLEVMLKDPMYKGWYKYVFYNMPEENKVENGVRIIYKDVFVRFRLPPELSLYGKERKFSYAERFVGIHRLMIGEDFQEEMDQIVEKNESLEKYVAKLEENEVKKFMSRMYNVITFNCNTIPYLHIRVKDYYQKDINDGKLENLTQEVVDKERKNMNNYINNEIRKYIINQPNYIDIFKKVIGKEISVLEASKLTNNALICEFT